MDLPSAWLTAGSCNLLWGEASTYGAVPTEFLPPVPPLDGSFAWLRRAPNVKSAMVYREQELGSVASILKEREAEAALLGLAIPKDVLTFLTDADLFTKIPSCTACFWDIGARLVPLPDHEGPERVLRFMNDQQGCAYWFLLVEPNRPARVAYGFYAFEDWDWDEEAEIDTALTLCADSFESFIWRWWIENAIWFAAHERRPLEGDLRAYSEAARASGFRFADR
jgi:hypothetical protein